MPLVRRLSLLLLVFAGGLAWPGRQPSAQILQSGMAPELLQQHLADVGAGRRMNFHCVGSGAPTVIFEQGGEGFISNWAKVQPAISELTRTCLYDRAGFGYSDPPDRPVTALSVTDDLHALLRKTRMKGPFVLVGHSVGGFYATMYADRFPSEVAGLVLVDSGFSGQDSGPGRPILDQVNNRRGEGYLVRCAALARAGKLTAANLAENRCITLPPNSTPVEARYILYAITRPYWHEAEHSQSVNYFTGDDEPSVSHAQEMAVSHAFGDIPMVVLSRSDFPGQPWRTDTENQRARDKWLAGAQGLAARSTRGRWSIVPGSDHFIQKSQPEAVIQAISQVVSMAREAGLRTAAGTETQTR